MNTLPDSLVRFEHDFEEAIRANVRVTRRRPRRPVTLRVAAAGVAAAAVALGVLSVLPGGGPSVVQRAAAALAGQTGSILHADVVVRVSAANGRASTREDDSWQQLKAPYDRRDVERGPSGLRVERSVSGGVAYLYDPATKTIYTAPIHEALRADVPVLVPIVGKIAARLAGTRAPSDLLRSELVTLLRSGVIVDGGRTTVDGHAARVFRSRDGSMTDLADADTYRPVRFTLAKAGTTLTVEFRAFEQLAGDAAGSLLSVQAQHPGARVDSDPGAYATVLPRLRPKG